MISSKILLYSYGYIGVLQAVFCIPTARHMCLFNC